MGRRLADRGHRAAAGGGHKNGGRRNVLRYAQVRLLLPCPWAWSAAPWMWGG